MKQRIISYFREVFTEGKKVSWATKKEVVSTSLVVFVMVTVFSLFFLLFDYLSYSAISAIIAFGR